MSIRNMLKPKNKEEVTKYFKAMSKEEVMVTFFQKVWQGDTAFLKVMLETLDIDVNVNEDEFFTDDENLNALMYAANSRNLEMAKLLLKHGADPNVRDNKNRTALMFACNSGYPKMVKVLLDAGALTHLKDIYGRGAMSRAVYGKESHIDASRYIEIISLLRKGRNNRVNENISHLLKPKSKEDIERAVGPFVEAIVDTILREEGVDGEYMDAARGRMYRDDIRSFIMDNAHSVLEPSFAIGMDAELTGLLIGDYLKKHVLL